MKNNILSILVSLLLVQFSAQAQSVVITPGPIDSVCPGASLTFTATTTGMGASPSFVWHVDSYTVGYGNTYTFDPMDSDIVSCTATGVSGGVPVTASYSVRTILPSYGVPSVSITSNPADSVCGGSQATFIATPSFGGNGPVYTWLVNGAIVGSGTVLTYAPLNADSISCILSSNYMCRLADSAVSNKRVMYVHPLLTPTVDIMVTPSLTLTTGETATFTAMTGNVGSDPHFQWYVNDTLISGAVFATFVHSAFRSGDSVSCFVTTSGICSGNHVFNWVIISEFPAAVPQLGLSTSDIQILPNPNNGTFTIKGTWGIADNEDASLIITDMLGQCVFTKNVKTQQGCMDQVISSGSIRNGNYILSVHKGSETREFHLEIE